MQIVFVVGSHRTGTKTLANFFQKQKNPSLWSCHQLKSMRWVNVFSTMLLEKKISKSLFELLIKLLIVKRIQQKKTDYYIEVNGFNYLAAHTVIKFYPDVKIVHLVRDPRDFVTSYLNWTHGKKTSRIASRYIPFWNVNGYRAGEVSRNVWQELTTFEQYCWLWTFKNTKIYDLYARRSTNYLLVRFEDLFLGSQKAKTLHTLMDFIGISYCSGDEEYFYSKQNESKKGFFPNWLYWEKEKCMQLQEMCGGLMRRYSYGEETEWKRKIGSLHG